jgi:hypothetical protein
VSRHLWSRSRAEQRVCPLQAVLYAMMERGHGDRHTVLTYRHPAPWLVSCSHTGPSLGRSDPPGPGVGTFQQGPGYTYTLRAPTMVQYCLHYPGLLRAPLALSHPPRGAEGHEAAPLPPQTAKVGSSEGHEPNGEWHGAVQNRLMQMLEPADASTAAAKAAADAVIAAGGTPAEAAVAAQRVAISHGMTPEAAAMMAGEAAAAAVVANGGSASHAAQAAAQAVLAAGGTPADARKAAGKAEGREEGSQGAPRARRRSPSEVRVHL